VVLRISDSTIFLKQYNEGQLTEPGVAIELELKEWGRATSEFLVKKVRR
jgi:hypothetical protein